MERQIQQMKDLLNNLNVDLQVLKNKANLLKEVELEKGFFVNRINEISMLQNNITEFLKLNRKLYERLLIIDFLKNKLFKERKKEDEN